MVSSDCCPERRFLNLNSFYKRIFMYSLLCAPFFFLLVALADERQSMSLDEALQDISVDELREHLTFIASDELEGRDSGSEGLRKAGQYLIKEYRRHGLQPMGDVIDGKQSFLQSVPCGEETVVSKTGNTLSIFADITPQTFEIGKQYTAFSMSANATQKNLSAVFVGYGITDEELGYDDYANVNVEGKLAVMFRYDYDEATHDKKYRLSQYASFVWKVRNALDHGAAAVMIVNGPLSKKAGKADPLFGTGHAGDVTNKTAAVIHAKRKVLAALLEYSGKDMTTLQRSLDKNKQPQSFSIPHVKVNVSVKLDRKAIIAENVIGWLEGSDPDLKDEFIVLGAHYDHVGYGYFGSLGGPKARGKIHNGADDNGSGTVGILEVMESLSQLAEPPKRSILLMHFCGEERGLIGSRYFANNPTVPLKKIVAMVNVDMIGRSNPTGKFNVGGVGTSPGFPDMLQKYNEQLGMNMTTSPSGKAPSDNTSFYDKGIPVLFYYAGGHPQYHTPEDDIELINFEGETQICRHMLLTVLDLCNQKTAPVFQKSESNRGVKLGIQPDTGFESDGVRVGSIVPDSVAAAAGLRTGDVIVMFNKKPIANLGDLRAVLKKYKKGRKAKLHIQRHKDGQQQDIILDLKF